MFYTLHILQTRFLNAYNAWGYKQVLEAIIDITDFEQKSSQHFPEFVDDLITLLPGLQKHKCDKNIEGRFVERLQNGTWIGHILEHIILELQTLAGLNCAFGQTRETDQKGIYFVVFETSNAMIGREALAQGINLILSLFQERKFNLTSSIERLKNCIYEYEIGSSTSVWLNAAKVHGIPYIQLNPPFNWFQLGYGKYSQSIWTSLTKQTNYISLSISQDKHLCKTLLQRFGIPVAEGKVCEHIDEAMELLENFKRVVTKPLDCNRSRGVSLDIQEQDKLIHAFKFAQEYSHNILVERFYSGDSYCINVVSKKVVGILKASEVIVYGDGQASISDLIKILNQDPRRGLGDKYPLPYIEENEALILLLSQQQYHLTSIPNINEKVIIQKNVFNETMAIENVHPQTLEQAILAVEIVNLDIGSVDLILKDPGQALSPENGVILEVNAGPGQFRNLIYPIKGPSSINLGDNLLKHIHLLNQQSQFIIGNVMDSTFDHYLFSSLKKTFESQHKSTGIVGPDFIDFPDYQINNPKLLFTEKCQLVLTHQELDSAIMHVNDFNLMHEGLITKNDFVIWLKFNFPSLTTHPYIQRPEHITKLFRTPLDVLNTDGVAILNGDDPFICELSCFSNAAVIFLSQGKTLTHLETYLKPDSKILHFSNQNIDLVIHEKRICLQDNVDIHPENILSYMANLGLCLHQNWPYQLHDTFLPNAQILKEHAEK